MPLIILQIKSVHNAFKPLNETYSVTDTYCFRDNLANFMHIKFPQMQYLLFEATERVSTHMENSLYQYSKLHLKAEFTLKFRTAIAHFFFPLKM